MYLYLASKNWKLYRSSACADLDSSRLGILEINYFLFIFVIYNLFTAQLLLTKNLWIVILLFCYKSWLKTKSFSLLYATVRTGRKQGQIRHRPWYIQEIVDWKDSCKLPRQLQTVKSVSDREVSFSQSVNSQTVD